MANGSSVYELSSRRVPMEAYDVVVVGGGPAGCAAAAAAARDGARTLLVESANCLGGMGTSGLLNQWMSFTDWNRLIIRGYAEWIFNTCKSAIPHAPALDCQPIDTELLKRVYDELVTSAGAEIRFHTQLASVETDKATGDVSAVLLASKAGLRAVTAKVYVDGTGDGDLAAWAGAPFHSGDEAGETMPTTLCFTLTNVDMYAYQHGPWLHPTVMNAILASKKFPDIPDDFLVPVVVGPGMIGCNAGHQWEVDPSKPETVTRAILQGRRTAKAFRDALAEFHPQAFANAHLAITASALGVRETRRIVGDHILTLDDYYARRGFDDEICRNAYYIDIHPRRGEKHGAVHADYKQFDRGETHSIPYRCLTPKGLRNVLVAGRCISCDRPVQAAIRIMPVCLGTGEAAGAAAAMACNASTPDVHAVDTTALCRRLVAAGAFLPEAKVSKPE